MSFEFRINKSTKKDAAERNKCKKERKKWNSKKAAAARGTVCFFSFVALPPGGSVCEVWRLSKRKTVSIVKKMVICSSENAKTALGVMMKHCQVMFRPTLTEISQELQQQSPSKQSSCR